MHETCKHVNTKRASKAKKNRSEERLRLARFRSINYRIVGMMFALSLSLSRLFCRPGTASAFNGGESREPCFLFLAPLHTNLLEAGQRIAGSLASTALPLR